MSMRTLGMIEQDADRLLAAVGTLERSAARLERARALIDYGAAIRRVRYRADARKPLREGLDLAHTMYGVSDSLDLDGGRPVSGDCRGSEV